MVLVRSSSKLEQKGLQFAHLSLIDNSGKGVVERSRQHTNCEDDSHAAVFGHTEAVQSRV